MEERPGANVVCSQCCIIKDPRWELFATIGHLQFVCRSRFDKTWSQETMGVSGRSMVDRRGWCRSRIRTSTRSGHYYHQPNFLRHESHTRIAVLFRSNFLSRNRAFFLLLLHSAEEQGHQGASPVSTAERPTASGETNAGERLKQLRAIQAGRSIRPTLRQRGSS